MVYVTDMHENYPAMVAGQEHINKFPNKVLISVKNGTNLKKNGFLMPIISFAPLRV